MRREEQPIEMIEIETLMERAAAKKIQGNRLVQIGCAVVEGVNEITYPSRTATTGSRTSGSSLRRGGRSRASPRSTGARSCTRTRYTTSTGSP